MVANKKWLSLLLGMVLVLVFGACSMLETQPTPTYSPVTPTPEPEKHVKLTFNVHVPLNTPSDQPIYLHIIDEVTGADFNTTTYQLPATGEDLYTININVPVDSVVFYRYANNTNSLEVDYTGAVVRHRIVHAYQHTEIDDTIVGWYGQPAYQGNLGRLSGKVVDEGQNPVAGVVVSAAGMETISDENGDYLFEFLPIGLHTIVVYSPDGSYQIFQQQAMIGTDLETKAAIQVNSSKFVSVVFVASIPADVLAGIPVRLVGNYAQLGGYNDPIWDGVGISAANAPVMARGTDGKHRLEVSLPVGAEVHYKYTLGDSLWSGEQSAEERFVVRRFIVPDHDIVLEDTVETWNSSQKGGISIITSIPEGVTQGDVWIQFKYDEDWMEPIPMWQIEGGKWFAVLTSPLDSFVNIKYRYCLNGDCDQSPEVNADGYLIQRNLDILPQVQNLENELIAWRFVEE